MRRIQDRGGVSLRGVQWSLWCAGVGALVLSVGCDDATPPADTALIAARSELKSGAVDEADRVQQFLDSRYRRSDVRHNYRGSNGQEIDCVDIMAQPALKHPGLRGHQPWTKPPSFLPPPRMSPTPIAGPEDDGVDEQGHGRRCPEGSVPIVRRTADSILRAGGLDAYLLHAGSKGPPPRHAQSSAPAPGFPAGGPSLPPAAGEPPSSPPSALPPSPGYLYGMGLQMNLSALNCPAPGAGSTLSVDWPHVLASSTQWGPGDHSISQIWLVSLGDTYGDFCTAPNCMQSVEAGWNIDPALYEDNYPHFFTYSTKDGYHLTGCYNLDPTCTTPSGITMTGSGLVLIQNPGMIPGWALVSPPVPTEIRVYWYKAPDKNWWLSANGWVGYIPASLFDNGNGGGAPLAGPDPNQNYYATYFEAGGEVADSGMLGTATTTDMGTGQFASAGYPGAAYQRNTIYTSNNCDPDSDQTDLPAPLNPFATDPTKYTSSPSPAAGGTGWGTYFYFGGPGAAPTVPGTLTGLTATPWEGAITLRWTATQGANTYDLHMSTSPTPPGPNDRQFGAISENLWPIDSLTDGTTYYFNVRAVNDAGTSAWSSQVSMSPHPPAPPVPTGLATHGGVQQVTLSWNPASFATSYTVKDATSATGSLGNAHSGITGTSYTYTGLSTNKTYYFVVSAQNATGSSADSARASGLTVTGAPSGVSATASSGKVTVKWSSTSGASSYIVLRSTTSGTTGSAIASGVTATSFADTAVTHGTKYYYTVVATNASGNSPNSSQVSATP